MSDSNEQKLDILDQAIDLLISGESVEAVSNRYPSYKDEIEAIGRMQTNLLSVKKATPSKDGLSRMLTSLRLKSISESKPAAFRFSSLFVTYKAAILVPLLFIVLIASGSLALPQLFNTPQQTATETSGEPIADSSADVVNQKASFANPTNPPAANMKAMSVMALAPARSPEPQDQEMAQIFGEELQGDVQASDADRSKAVSATDDTASMERYYSIYDENDF